MSQWETEEYPSFKEFADFVAQEAEVAWNPATSFHALKRTEEKPPRDINIQRLMHTSQMWKHQIQKGKRTLCLQTQLRAWAVEKTTAFRNAGGSLTVIAPVWVSSTTTPETEISLYARDTQSRNTFVAQRVDEFRANQVKANRYDGKRFHCSEWKN